MSNVNQFKKSRLVLGLFLGLNSSAVFAAPFGLTEIYQKALGHDASLAQAKAQYQADIQAIDTARSALLPQIQADGSYAINDSSIDSSDVTTQDLSITLNQSLYQHSNWARYEQSKQSSDVALATLKNAEQTLILSVAKSYFSVLLAQQSLVLTQSKQASNKLQYETALASAELGLLSRVDVLEAKSSFDIAKSETIQAENALDNAQEALAKISGVSAINIQQSGLKVLELNSQLPELNLNETELENLAKSQNLTVKIAQSQTDVASSEIEVQKSGYWPTVALQAKYSDTRYSSNGTGLADNDRTSVAVTVSMPLYSGGGTSSQVTAAKQESMAAQQALRNAKENAALEVRTQLRNLHRGEKLINALREAVKSNDAFVESAQEGYKVGLKSMLEVLTATANQTNAHRTLIEAIHNQVLSHLTLEASIGDLTLADIERYEPLLQAKP